MRSIRPAPYPAAWSITPPIAISSKLTSAYGVSVVISGPLQSDDGDTMIGSLFIIDAPSRAEVEDFYPGRPFPG